MTDPAPLSLPVPEVTRPGSRAATGQAASETALAARRLLFIRLVVVIVALAVLLIAQKDLVASSDLHVVYGVILAAIVLNFVYRLTIRREGLAGVVISTLIVVDLFLVSCLIYFTGGMRSPFTIFYFGPILAASLTLSPRTSLLYASLALTMLSCVSIAYGLGYAPFRFTADDDPQIVRRTVAFQLSQGLAFFLVSMLSSRLARRLGAERLLSEEILENIGQGLLVIGAGGHIEYANTEVKNLLGIPDEKLAGLRPDDALPGERLDGVRTALDDDQPVYVELSIERPGDEPIALRMKTVPVPALLSTPSADARPRGRIAVFTDLTLETRVEEATRQAERSEAVSALATSIAHELRNPLASIRGAIQEVHDSETLSDPSARLMQIVLSESDRLDGIISDFLQFARLPEVRRVPCDLRPIIEETVEMVRTRPDAEAVEIECDLSADLPAVVDRGQIRQALLNLALNSLDALQGRSAGEIRIRARRSSYRLFTRESLRIARADRKDVSGMQVEISDSGVGMDEDTRLRAFDPFFTTREEGTGLGLAIVARIVQAHGGEIDLHSVPGEGTTFRIWLPDL